MDIFDLFATISLDTGDYERALDRAEQRTESFAARLTAGLSETAAAGKADMAGLGQAAQALAAQTAALGTLLDVEGQALKGQMNDIGQNMARGLWEGLKSMDGWLQTRVDGMLTSVAAGARRTLGIKSPSRVFAQMGVQMAQGLGQGWTAGMEQVRHSVEDSLRFEAAQVPYERSGAARLGREGTQPEPAEGATIVVQSVLDGRVIGETAYQYSRSKQRAYGV